MRIQRYSVQGFTLIELMIVVAVMAILLAATIPMYNEQVKKSRRTDAQRELISWVQMLERQYTTNATYIDCSFGRPGDSKFYTFSATTCTQTTFAISATPKPGTPQANDGVMTLNNTGARTPADKWVN